MTDNRAQSPADALASTIQGQIAGIRTAIPGIIESFDAATQTATVAPAIRKLQTLADEQSFVDIPPIINVPVIYPHAQTAGFAITLPISAGDQVLLVVADRSIDYWAEVGGVQNFPQTTAPRSYDITDALAIIGATPIAAALSSWQSDGVEIRNAARNVYLNLTNNAVEINVGGTVLTINASGAVTLDANTLTINCPVNINGRLSVAGGNIAHNGTVIGRNHRHVNVEPGNGVSGAVLR